MIRIGICDDNKKDRQYLERLCVQYFDKVCEKYVVVFFESGEEILEYCNQRDNKRIDLLFLDIEMCGISGIEVKNRILKRTAVWRIVFVSCYKEKVFDSFGLKTLGFVVKPVGYADVEKWISFVLQELKEEVYIELNHSLTGEKVIVRLEDLEYIKADRNYTDVYLHSEYEDARERLLLSDSIGVIEKKLQNYSVIRVHRSYLVNLINVTKVGRCIKVRDMEAEIPIGRSYREYVLKKYREYGKEKIERRL